MPLLDRKKVVLEPVRLPIAHSGQEADSIALQQVDFVLTSKFAATVKNGSSQKAQSDNTFLLAIFATLLYRYSLQETFTIGLLTQPEGECKRVAWVNCNCGDRPTFQILEDRIKQANLDSLCMDWPGAREDRVANGQSESASSAVIFSCGAHSEPLNDSSADSGFELGLFMDLRGEDWHGRLVFNAARYDRDSIERMTGHYQVLLEAALQTPAETIDRLPLLTAAERQQLLFDWNDTSKDFPQDTCIHEFFERQVERTPDAIALLFQGREWTYRQLNERANQLAHYLRTLDVRPGVLVGICIRRSADMIVGAMAIVKAGGAYVPLDPAYPKDRLAFMLEDTAATILISERTIVPQLPETKAKLLCIDELEPLLTQYPNTNPPRSASPTDRAYIIYTSGSTGKPKGVVLRHRPVANVLQWVNDTFQVGPADRLLFVTSLNFDLSVYDIFGILGSGASIRVTSLEELRDPERLLHILLHEPITFWDSAPPMLQQVMPFIAQVTPGEHTQNLRLVFLSGDWIPVALPDQMRAVFPRAQIVSLGGATEASIWSNYYAIGRVDPAWPSIPYGKPIQNARYHILDSNLQPVPIGIPAELHIGGLCLADGYLNRAELSKERFIPDPFFQEPDARLYKTGDLARYFPDGNIEFLGRLDHQVKIRGYRIELGEIEAAVLQFPRIRETVITALTDSAGEKSLVAYFVPREAQPIPVEEIRRFLRARLPEYMVPAHLIQLHAFPLNPNGKIDRKALPAPDREQVATSRTIVAPRIDAERDLLAVWEEVLNIRPISVTDNFFELGGHSFTAAVLITKIKERLGHQLSFGSFFAAPTIEQQAATLQQNLEAGSTGSIVPLHAEGSKPPLFLIAGVGGHVFTFHKFAGLLGDDQPTFGIKAIGVDGTCEPLERIEEIAGQYLNEIRALYPHGPYQFGGYSIGALVAYELACRFREQGEKVDLLAVFDMVAPGYPKKLPRLKRLAVHFKNFLALTAEEKRSYVAQRYLNVKQRLYQRLGWGAYNAPVIAGLDALPQDALKKVWAGLQKAKSCYWPRYVFDGKIVLFKAAEGFVWAATVFDDPQMGWGRWCTGAIEEHTIPGAHLDMFHDNNIHSLASLLRDAGDQRSPADDHGK